MVRTYDSIIPYSTWKITRQPHPTSFSSRIHTYLYIIYIVFLFWFSSHTYTRLTSGQEAAAFLTTLELVGLNLDSNVTETRVDMMIGPAWSFLSMSTQLAAVPFGLPQISFSASSQTLTQPEYETFNRVCPNDATQAKVLLKLIQMHDWSEVSVIHSNDAYSSDFVQEFSDNAGSYGVEIMYVHVYIYSFIDLSDTLTQSGNSKHTHLHS